ncbi:MAG: 16S rRNA (cytosine(967)-C(5))-methyltransferase RsmB [Clostridiales bacterium]|nr:16S rRNA (cytosine(967)-C(5))-methyltransferase RsmB [Clostridiales bacterium]
MEKLNEREEAYEALLEAERPGPANKMLKRRLDGLGMDTRGKAFVVELAQGTTRRKMLLDYIIGLSSRIPTEKMQPEVRIIIRMAVYQMRYMDKVPDRAAVDEAVKLAKKKGFGHVSGFVNGVLRNVGRQGPLPLPGDLAQRLSLEHSYPSWIVEYLIKNFGPQRAELVCKAGSERPMITLCPNMLKTTAEDLALRLSGEGMEAHLEEGSVTVAKAGEIAASKAYAEGLFHVMDRSSAACAWALDPQKGETIADVCAAPGGKSFLCAMLMGNEGRIMSMDKDKRRVDEMGRQAKRLGIRIIEAGVRNALEPLEEIYDRVLVDAPCSGFGVASRKPDVKYGKSMKDVKSLAELQKGILGASCQGLKAGGRLVYSVCTYTVEECEEVSRWAVENLPLSLEEEKRIWPGDGWDGFYIARFAKR